MQEVYEQLEKALSTTFLSNLNFLRDYDNDLFLKVDTLSKLIGDGIYKEKYALDFIEENGDFDIYDIVNDRYLCERKPKEFNNKIVNKVHFDKKDTISTLEKFVYKKDVPEIDRSIKNNLQDLSDSDLLVVDDVSKYVHALKDELDDKKKNLKKIPKIIFLGTFLGRHISRIAEKIDAEIYFVCEKNLELFRLSLFTTDYTILVKNNGVIFSIMDEEDIFDEKILKFLSVNPFDNYLIKLSSSEKGVDGYIDKILTTIIQNKPTLFDYTRSLYTLIRNSSARLSSDYNTLLMNKLKNNLDIFKQKPVLFIAAGPSLDDNISWIKENQDKFFITTIGASFKKLFDNQIKVDLLISLDSKYNGIGDKQFSVENSKLLKDTIVISSMMTDKRVLERFNQEKLFLYEVFTCFHYNNSLVQGFSVGEVAVGLLLKMNVKELYLVGLDMAINKDTGDTHSKDDTSTDMLKYNLENKLTTVDGKKVIGLKTGLFKVKGNFEDEVFTSRLYNASLECINEIFLEKEKDVNIYNLSDHGAYFKNTIPTIHENIQLEKEIEFNNEELITIFKNNSSNELSLNSKKRIKSEIAYIEEILNNDLELFKKSAFKDFSEFSSKSFEMFLKLIQLDVGLEVRHILFKNYFVIIFNYLEYHFNDVKIKNESKKVNNIKKILISQLEVLIIDYLKYLRNLI